MPVLNVAAYGSAQIIDNTCFFVSPISFSVGNTALSVRGTTNSNSPQTVWKSDFSTVKFSFFCTPLSVTDITTVLIVSGDFSQALNDSLVMEEYDFPSNDVFTKTKYWLFGKIPQRTKRTRNENTTTE